MRDKDYLLSEVTQIIKFLNNDELIFVLNFLHEKISKDKKVLEEELKKYKESE